MADLSRHVVLVAWILGSRVRISLKAWMFVFVFRHNTSLVKQRPSSGVIARPSSVAKRLKVFIISEEFLN
jgi:hypothetical protein